VRILKAGVINTPNCRWRYYFFVEWIPIGRALSERMIIAQQIFRALALFFGLVLLLFGLWDLLVPRARFVNSNPAAGAVIDVPPSSVAVSFTNKLDPESRINVTSTIELLPSGEHEYLAGGSVITKSEIDPGDASGKTLRAHLRPGLHKGIYWVSWTTKVSGWGSISNGTTVFGVGMKVPEHLTEDMDGATRERNYQHRGRRAALIGGVVMLVLGLFLRVPKPVS
jgi:methionine-rich copper-binding protein CopC